MPRSKRSLGSRDRLRCKMKQMREPEIEINLVSGEIRSFIDGWSADCGNYMQSGVYADGFICDDCT